MSIQRQKADAAKKLMSMEDAKRASRPQESEAQSVESLIARLLMQSPIRPVMAHPGSVDPVLHALQMQIPGTSLRVRAGNEMPWAMGEGLYGSVQGTF